MAGLTLIERALLFYGARIPYHPGKWQLHDRLRQSLGVAVDRELEVVRQGLRWSLNPADFEHAGLFWLGSKDTWDIYHLRSLLGPGAVFFDIGANFGFYSLTLAKFLNRQCRIYAFEPNPKTCGRLRHHIDWNALQDVIQAYELALSDTEGSATLIERPDNSGASRLGSDAAGISVQLTTLDAFCSAQGVDRVDALKIDVEGHEARMLKGGMATLSRLKPVVIIEFWTTGLERAGSSVDEVADVLRALGYQFFKPRREQLVPIADPPQSEDPQNVFCFHPDRPRADFQRHRAPA